MLAENQQPCGLDSITNTQNKLHKDNNFDGYNFSSYSQTPYKDLTSSELRAEYPKTFNSHRNMLARRKLGAIIHPSLLKFRDFLTALGPCEEP